MSNSPQETATGSAEFVLDISGEVCPLTFVRTKLLIERMRPGDTAEILLRGAEPIGNVPRAVARMGHEIVELIALEPSAGGDGLHRLRIRKSAGASSTPS